MNKERAKEIINTEVIETLKSHQQMSACFDYDEDGNAKPNNNYAYYDELLQALYTIMDSLDNEWVDVRDRLPSDDEIAENYGEFEITYFDTILKHQVTIAEFCKSNKYAIVEKDERGHWYDWEDDEIIDVIAWRPLPKPYERKE